MLGEIKQRVTNFIVREIVEVNGREEICNVKYTFKERVNDFFFNLRYKFSNKKKLAGRKILCDLLKVNISFFELLHKARRYGIKIKFFGIKDKFAITSQKVIIDFTNFKKVRKLCNNKILFKNFRLISKEDRIKMKGNNFIITIREIPYSKREIEKILTNSSKVFPNLFGEQRFGLNEDVGREILKRNFEKALRIFVCKKKFDNYWGNFEKLKKITKGYFERIVIKKLRKGKSYVEIIRCLPKYLRRIFVEAYQSKVFNEVAISLWEKGYRENFKIPLIGYKTKLDRYFFKEKIERILKKDGIKLEYFKIPEIGIKIKGSERDYLAKAKDFRIIYCRDGEAKVSFNLPRGSYATVFLKFLK